MKRIDIVYEKLKELTSSNNEWISAQQLASILKLDRANVSSDLNKLWKKGKVQKRNGRPVLFSVVRQKSSEMFLTKLDELMYHQPSLAIAVEQGKAAILYPPKGMHMLILGETGTGKSMFAELLHEFSIEIRKCSQDAPFIAFNCADYANNPQLLLGQLFGVKKGAYTGAAEQKGLIEKANNGILFLDEVHRLPAEGQEMLFTFIDKGVYRRLGETETVRSANVLLICATTENPESSLLTTFRRRIPMNIYLPPLRERTTEERCHLIFHFFREEAIRLGKEIHVSANTVRAFLCYPCPNNVGQLKADIQLACAKAYADYVTAKKKKVQINSPDLPHYIKEGLFIAKKQARSLVFQYRYYIFSPDREEMSFEPNEADYQNIYESIERKFNELKAHGVNDDELELLMEIDVENYFTQYMKGVNRRIHTGNDLAKIIDPPIIQLAETIIQQAERALRKRFAKKVVYGLALHIQTSIQRIQNGKKIMNPHLNKVRMMYKNEFNLALDCMKMIEEHTGLDLPIDEASFLTMFFVLDNEAINDHEEHVSILVMMHGNGAATAMADVTNHLLATDHVKAIDMPMHLEPKEIYERAKMLVKQIASKKGLLLLVDMGSLTTFGELLEKEVGIPVKVVSAISTPHVLEAARKAIVGYSLEEIYEDVKNVTPFYVNRPLWNGDEQKQEKFVIITACVTGKGSALAIKKVLETYLHFDNEFVDIIPIHVASEKDMQMRLSQIEKHYRLLCVISNVPFLGKTPYFYIEEVLSLRAIKSIQKLIDIEETYTKMIEILTNHLQCIRASEGIAAIRCCFANIQQKLQINVHPHDMIGMVLHTCCMLDRLIAGDNSVQYEQKEKYIKENEWLYHLVKKELHSLEKKYRVNLTKDELCYIMKFFEYCKTNC
ncbi:sigma 54-interacting transcriptional regulator [Thermaerobacillus caldiproteolyticus]|uniref:Transcriptional regulatory protein LevR/transcriptional regulator with AAA-type ATPase domain n=1 Tax=Thermaerobacillus caldiproteolyticus TaxID=247480 RepID=A0A7W0C118_9BACL|nr:sigma-54-dependent transcriptional regulator [Anoxybacillus caldiproteolyticus]MBA2876429.1 transcriptional regulatory protein LevR/transcriptional regulator with AAA-type ATPase domain [Anoxybacillus caldiproteolyticus]